ncbi:MAG: S8 family serine peptidase [Acidobacteria bacterium]|nr:S8 family serine peptidase [Acidobacteriota bacterium]
MWERTTGSTATVIAVIDSGVDFTHPDLARNGWANPAERANDRDDDRDGYADDLHGWDWVTDGNQIKDEQGHGTSIAGIIAAEGNNVEGTTGVMWRARLMSLRVLDGTGTGDVADAVEAIDYAVAHGAQVINISWGLDTHSLALRDALERAAVRGVVVVCSAGNNGRNIDSQPYYPAAYDLPNLISVAAPGVNILTTRMGGDYHSMTGTSAAAPLVSGIAGLIRTAYPRLNVADTRASIVTGTRQVGGLSGKVASGGVAQAAGALNKASGIGSGASGGGTGTGSGNNGNGGNNVGGNNGAGNSGWHGPSPRPGAPGFGPGGRGPGGSFDAQASAPTKDAPPNFLNQDEVRRRGAVEPQARPFIQSNSLPACDVDCDSYSIGGAGGSDPYFGTARNLPGNRTGATEGVDPGSRNFNWSTPLLSLAGRAGHDLNIALYYNSLVWTKQGNTLQYNADHGFPGPGFHLGFPTLQPIHYNSDTGAYAYTMITSSGGRVSMQQIPGTNNYESADGTYTHLTGSNTGGPALVRTSDGTQLTFVYYTAVNEYRATQIKDRNGNFITINYGGLNNDPALGRVGSVVDTLGRTITFNYNTLGYLETITQAWQRETPAGVVSNETHEWARFYYGTVTLQPNFPNLNVVAPTSAIPVLSRVDLQNKSSFQFEYDAGWGMVKRISQYGPGPGSRLLNYTFYTFPNSATAHSDCPRITERRDWATEWNNNQEAVTNYGVAENITWPANNPQHTGTRTTITSPVFYDKDNTPKQIVTRVYAHATGWDTGLPRLEETYEQVVNGAATLVRTVQTDWTQDNTTLSYAKNPRPVERNVSDPNMTPKRTRIDYGSYSLPSIIYEYGADAQTLVRQTNFAYNLSSVYLDKRIIGLKSAQEVYDVPAGYQMVARTTYDYDTHALENAGTVSQHEGAAYGAGVVAGRGNLTAVYRFDATAPFDTTKMSTTSTGYDTAGNVVWAKDGENHQTTISYADNYSQGANMPNTRAFPTTVTDPDGYNSTAQYNYALGAVYTTADPKGAAQKTHYDDAGRVLRVTNTVNDFYTRYEYDPNYGHTRSYTPTETGEAYTNTITNGAGEVYLFVASHPNSTGGYLATQTKYDALGRAVEQSNPTEIYGDGTPAGDDQFVNGAGGYRWTKQAYDWKGRPTLTVFPAVAGQTLGNTKELTYSRCGCAGGEVVTFRDERGRRRVLSKDIFGRLKKVEEMNWDGQTIYSTTTYDYNARDQITQVNQQGQVRTLEYDGHGRLWKRTTPEQGTTTYLYNRDDTTLSATDARNVTTAFVYYNRHLVKNINYTIPAGSPVAATTNASFEYDEAGNRTKMTNGVQVTDYHYDGLSRMDYEEINLTDFGTVKRRIKYEYNKAGQLTRLTNPFGAEVAYTYDANGRTTDVRGTNAQGYATYMGVPDYALNLRYRAFGGMKGLTYGNNKTLALTYDERLRVKTWNVAGVLGWEYRYDKFMENSHRVTYAKNISSLNQQGVSASDPTLDRSYDYDQVGRLRHAHSGREARMHASEPYSPTDGDGPYSQRTAYDVWGNIKEREGWGGILGSYLNQTFYFADNKQTNLDYDPAGNLRDDGGHYTYNAQGQQADAAQYPPYWGGYPSYSLQQAYDGDGLRVKKVDNGTPVYYLRSSVLGGQVVAEVDWQGTWQRGYVYLNGQLLLIQSGGVPKWVHQDPVTKSQRLTDFYGALQAVVDLDPWGGETARSWQQGRQPRKYTSYERDGNHNDQAMFRNYHGGWMRFDQPDPYDGSYDMSDPQSLNRYAYVQNDPVNFVDPLGLNLAEVRCQNYGWFPTDGHGNPTGPQIGGDITICVTVGNGDTGRRGPTDVGDGVGGGSGNTENQEPLPFDSCTEFVNYLVNSAIEASKQVLYNSSKATFLGGRMMDLAFNGYARHINNGFSGFKEELISGGQGAGVYGHILGQGGAKLVGWQGMIFGGIADAYDHAQRLSGTQQGSAEVAGNKAGWTVGDHI